MAITRLDSENGDRDLASGATVLTYTVAADTICQCIVYMGDGAKNLDGSGGGFTIQVTLDSQEGITVTRTIGTVARAVIQTDSFAVPASAQVLVEVVSPNGADSDVDVTAYLFDVSASATSIASDAKLLMDSETDVICSDLRVTLDSETDVICSNVKVLLDSEVDVLQSDLTIVRATIPAQMRYHTEVPRTINGRPL